MSKLSIEHGACIFTYNTRSNGQIWISSHRKKATFMVGNGMTFCIVRYNKIIVFFYLNSQEKKRKGFLLLYSQKVKNRCVKQCAEIKHRSAFSRSLAQSDYGTISKVNNIPKEAEICFVLDKFTEEDIASMDFCRSAWAELWFHYANVRVSKVEAKNQSALRRRPMKFIRKYLRISRQQCIFVFPALFIVHACMHIILLALFSLFSLHFCFRFKYFRLFS